MAESDNSNDRVLIHPDRGGERSAMAGADEQRAIAEVQGQILMARRFPREIAVARDNILEECRRLGLAEDALYAYPRGDEEIEGPSIRLAEVLARHWGNMSSGIQELAQHGNMSDVEAFCWDLQTNNRWSVKFVVPHFRDTKNGRKPLRDGRDVYEMVANLGSRRLRACILRAIPGDIVDEAVNECKKTIQRNAGPLSERIAKAIERFGVIGVPKESLVKFVGHNLEACKEPELRRLAGAYNAIKDGFSTKESIFSDLLPAGSLSDEEAAAQAGVEARGPAMPEATGEKVKKDEKLAEDRPNPNAKISPEQDALAQKALGGFTEAEVAGILEEFKVGETFELTRGQLPKFIERAGAIFESHKGVSEAKPEPEKEKAEAPKAELKKAEPPKQQEPPKQEAPKQEATAPASDADGEKLISKEQQKQLFTVGQQAGLAIGAIKKIIKDVAGVDISASVKIKFFEPLMTRLAAGK